MQSKLGWEKVCVTTAFDSEIRMPGQKFTKNVKVRPKKYEVDDDEEKTKSVAEERGRKLSNTSLEQGRSQLDKTPAVGHRVIDLVESIISSSSTSSGNDDEKSASGSLVAALPKQQTNRQAYGTWNRDFDFTVTCIGYVIGLPNFFRFPFLCYKFGTIPFLIPYVLAMFLVGIPIVFMEITIGQFFGVGSISAFRQMAPVITGVSYMLAWNSFISCWTTGAMLSWIRVYSGSSLSCLRGWQGCAVEHYYNTPMCWTGQLEDCCGYHQSGQCPPNTVEYTKNITENHDGPMPESIYYNFDCIKTEDFCQLFGWKHTARKQCTDAKGRNHSVYERRQHAAVEYLHGYVMGLRSQMTHSRRSATIKACKETFKNDTKKCDRISLFESPHEDFKAIRDQIAKDPVLLQKLWKNEKKERILHQDPESSSNLNLPILAFTTVLFITLFLFDDLLRVSAVQYIFNGIPFCLLFYMLFLAFQFNNSDLGVYKIFDLDSKQFMHLLTSPEVWVEAVVQVLATTGVGNGALISLASFNKYQHRYLFDVILIIVLSLVISMSATLLCFCTIAHYMKTYNVLSVSFQDFIRLDNGITPVQFGFVVYSLFVTLLEGKDIHILLFFFMFSSFPSDTAIRLAQSILDAAVHILPRLRHHSTMALLAVVSFYYLTLLPVTQNSGVYTYTNFEHYSLKFAFPAIIFVEVLSVGFVYKAQLLMENAEQLGVISSNRCTKYLLVGLKYTTPIILGFTLVGSIYLEIRYQINPIYELTSFTKTFAVAFSLLPMIMILFNVAKQLIAFPRSKWPELFKPVNANEVQRKMKKKGTINTPDRLLMFPERISSASTSTTTDQPEVEPVSLRQSISQPKGVIRKPGEDSPEGQSPSHSIAAGSQTNLRSSLVSDRLHLRDKAVSFSGSPTRSKSQQDAAEDSSSVNSDEVSTWQRYIFWTEIANHIEDWPERLDETDFESEGSSDDSDGGSKRARVFHVHYPVMKPQT